MGVYLLTQLAKVRPHLPQRARVISWQMMLLNAIVPTLKWEESENTLQARDCVVVMTSLIACQESIKAAVHVLDVVSVLLVLKHGLVNAASSLAVKALAVGLGMRCS